MIHAATIYIDQIFWQCSTSCNLSIFLIIFYLGTAGLTLALFGGVQKYVLDQNKVPVRGDIHVLIVGKKVFCNFSGNCAFDVFFGMAFVMNQVILVLVRVSFCKLLLVLHLVEFMYVGIPPPQQV